MVSSPVTSQKSAADKVAADGNRRLFLVLTAIAVVYAFLANFRTISEPDLFWQLATGRWVAQHHHVFSTDVFSYTAQGQPWIYPVGSGLLFYIAYLIGGFGLISWLAALACAGTVALLLRRGSAASAAVAILLVPLIAARSAARAELFTIVLFAAFLSILWENFTTGRARLWWLPLLMIAWVNLHLGFVAGLGLIFAFAGMEVLEMLFGVERRRAAVARLKRAGPWFIASIVATLVNPWGWGIYSALVRQSQATAVHSEQIAEWGSIPLNWAGLATAFSLRNTTGSFYVLLLIMIVAAVIAIFQRQIGALILLAGAAYEGAQHVRMEALSACLVIVVGGAMLASAAEWQWVSKRTSSPRARSNIATAVATVLAIFAFVRAFDVVTNYRHHSISRFGAGLSWWVPEAAAQFVEREKLPGEIFNTYDEGGFIVWRLGPARRDYIDGRAIPFGTAAFQHLDELMLSSPDSDVWQKEADRYNINTIILPLVRFENWKGMLPLFCASNQWKPVYLDEISAVIVRRTPQTEELIKRSPVDCSTAHLPSGPLSASSEDAFNQWANAATALAVLGRNYEALDASAKALAIFPDDSFVHWLRGLIFTSMGRASEAEGEFRATVELEPGSAIGWFSLSGLYQHDGRITDAIYAQRRAIDASSTPQPIELLKLAGLYLRAKDPKAALNAFDDAERAAPPEMLAARGARTFRYNVATGRAEAWRDLGDIKRAHMYDQQAVQNLMPR